MPIQKDTFGLGSPGSREKVFRVTKSVNKLPDQDEIIITAGGFLYMDERNPLVEEELGEELLPRLRCG